MPRRPFVSYKLQISIVPPTTLSFAQLLRA
jgi:hypothetical protein